jgi:hypothetical protein
MRHRPILAPSLLRSHSPGVVALRSPHPGCLIPVVSSRLSRAGSSAPVSRAGRPDPVTRQPRVWCRSLPDRSPGLGRVGLSRRPPRAWRRVQRSRDDGEPVTLRDPVGSRGDPRAVSTNSIPTGAASSTARSSSTGRRPTSMDEVTTPFATRSHLITLLNRCRRESIRPGVPDGHLRCPLRADRGDRGRSAGAS